MIAKCQGVPEKKPVKLDVTKEWCMAEIDALRAELKKIRDWSEAGDVALAIIDKDRSILRAENVRLREALRFYATKGNAVERLPVFMDNGERARDVLGEG
jgi:hypothetical protein